MWLGPCVDSIRIRVVVLLPSSLPILSAGIDRALAPPHPSGYSQMLTITIVNPTPRENELSWSAQF